VTSEQDTPSHAFRDAHDHIETGIVWRTAGRRKIALQLRHNRQYVKRVGVTKLKIALSTGMLLAVRKHKALLRGCGSWSFTKPLRTLTFTWIIFGWSPPSHRKHTLSLTKTSLFLSVWTKVALYCQEQMTRVCREKKQGPYMLRQMVVCFKGVKNEYRLRVCSLSSFG
jgi:hypothetical protein